MITFSSVKALTDVHVALDSDENASDLYEIVIGGWGDSASLVRRGKQGTSISTWPNPTPKILSTTEFRGFWIRTEKSNNKLLIHVGKDGESVPFMTGIDKNLIEIRFVGLA